MLIKKFGIYSDLFDCKIIISLIQYLISDIMTFRCNNLKSNIIFNDYNKI